MREGDSAARTALIARIQPLLMRFAHGRLPGLLRSSQDTADLLQMTWIKALDRIEDIECKKAGALFAYLRTVLVNTLREELRRHNGDPQREDESALQSLPAAGGAPDDWIAYEQMLGSLDESHRTLMVMRFEFGMSFAEIGDELELSADAVRMQLNRAVQRLARMESEQRSPS